MPVFFSKCAKKKVCSWCSLCMNSKEDSLIRNLQSFYQSHPSYLTFVQSVASGKNHTISLRILDWLCTSYAKRHNVVIFQKDRVLHLHTMYKAFLSSHSKKLFDAFRRRQRVQVTKSGLILSDATESEDTLFISTIAQLMFFFWCYERGIVEYAEENVNAIESDLRSYVKEKQKEPSAMIVHSRVVVDFD